MPRIAVHVQVLPLHLPMVQLMEQMVQHSGRLRLTAHATESRKHAPCFLQCLSFLGLCRDLSRLCEAEHPVVCTTCRTTQGHVGAASAQDASECGAKGRCNIFLQSFGPPSRDPRHVSCPAVLLVSIRTAILASW